jgi:hypothetical protein
MSAAWGLPHAAGAVGISHCRPALALVMVAGWDGTGAGGLFKFRPLACLGARPSPAADDWEARPRARARGAAPEPLTAVFEFQVDGTSSWGASATRPGVLMST